MIFSLTLICSSNSEHFFSISESLLTFWLLLLLLLLTKASSHDSREEGCCSKVCKYWDPLGNAHTKINKETDKNYMGEGMNGWWVNNGHFWPHVQRRRHRKSVWASTVFRLICIIQLFTRKIFVHAKNIEYWYSDCEHAYTLCIAYYCY